MRKIGKLGKVLGRHDYVVRHFGHTENGLAVLDFTSGVARNIRVTLNVDTREFNKGIHAAKRKLASI